MSRRIFPASSTTRERRSSATARGSASRGQRTGSPVRTAAGPGRGGAPAVTLEGEGVDKERDDGSPEATTEEVVGGSGYGGPSTHPTGEDAQQEQRVEGAAVGGGGDARPAEPPH